MTSCPFDGSSLGADHAHPWLVAIGLVVAAMVLTAWILVRQGAREWAAAASGAATAILSAGTIGFVWLYFAASLHCMD